MQAIGAAFVLEARAPNPRLIMASSRQLHRISWLAALGLACLASSAALRRRLSVRDERPVLPERLYRRADDLLQQLFD